MKNLKFEIFLFVILNKLTLIFTQYGGFSISQKYSRYGPLSSNQKSVPISTGYGLNQGEAVVNFDNFITDPPFDEDAFTIHRTSKPNTFVDSFNQKSSNFGNFNKINNFGNPKGSNFDASEGSRVNFNKPEIPKQIQPSQSKHGFGGSGSTSGSGHGSNFGSGHGSNFGSNNEFSTNPRDFASKNGLTNALPARYDKDGINQNQLFPSNFSDPLDYLYEDTTEAPKVLPNAEVKNVVNAQEGYNNNYQVVNPSATRVFQKSLGPQTPFSAVAAPAAPANGQGYQIGRYGGGSSSPYQQQPCCSCCNQNQPSRYFSYQTPQGPQQCSCSNGCGFGFGCSCSCRPYVSLNFNQGCYGNSCGGGVGCGSACAGAGCGSSCGNGSGCGQTCPIQQPTKYRCSCNQVSCTCVPSYNVGCGGGGSGGCCNGSQVTIVICCKPGTSNCRPCNRKVLLKRKKRTRRTILQTQATYPTAQTCDNRCCNYSKCQYSLPKRLRMKKT